jgi:hypothetical protein
VSSEAEEQAPEKLAAKKRRTRKKKSDIRRSTIPPHSISIEVSVLSVQSVVESVFIRAVVDHRRRAVATLRWSRATADQPEPRTENSLFEGID